MVKKLLKFFMFLFFFLFALALFTPKESLYFLFEKELKEYEVVISNEIVHERLLSLELRNLEVSVKGIESAVIEDAEISLLAFYNSVKLKNIKLSSLAESYAPTQIDSLEVSYTLLNIFSLQANAQGGFGEAKLRFSLVNRELQVVLKPSKLMIKEYKKTMKYLKKAENGEYTYAKTF